MKLVSGTLYVFQANRAKFNHNKVDATCLLCNAEDEDIEHLFLRCSVLDEIRNSTIHDMDIEYYKPTEKKLEDLAVKEKIAIILDCSILLNNGAFLSSYSAQSDYKESIGNRISLSEIRLQSTQC